MPPCNQKHEKKREIAFIDESKVEANTNQGVSSDVKQTLGKRTLSLQWRAVD